MLMNESSESAIWLLKSLFLFVLSELNDTLSDNNDTVGQIVRYIMKNEGTCPSH